MINLLHRGILLDNSGVDQRNPIGHNHGIERVRSGIDDCLANLLLHRLELPPHLLSDLIIKVDEGFIK